MVDCDSEVPDQLKYLLTKVSPIIKNVRVEQGYIGDAMEAFAEEHDLLTIPGMMLVGSLFANNNRLIALPLQWYICQAFVVL